MLHCLYVVFGQKEIPVMLFKDKEDQQQIAEFIHKLFPKAELIAREINFEDGIAALLDPEHIAKILMK